MSTIPFEARIAHGRVFSYDRAGMGSSPSDGLGSGAPAVTARLAQLVAQAGVRKPFILAGYSLGGLYARHYAGLHPQDVAGLALVDATPTTLEIPQARIRKALRTVGLLHWVARSGLGTLYGVLSGRIISADKFKRMVARLAAPGYPQSMRDEIDAITSVKAEVARVASQLQHPTLAVIAGVAPSKKLDAELARVRVLHDQLAATAPAPLSRQVMVKDANHSTLLSDPRHAEEVAAHVLTFARSLPSNP